MRIRLAHLLAWCSPGLPVAALGLPLVVYLPPHYAGTLGLPLATVGFLFALVRIVDIPLDPLLGALMDNTRSRWGQFRPWIVGGALVMMLGAVLLFLAEPGVTAVRTFAALFILYVGFSCMNLAQVSWGSRLSGDYGERARIFGVWTAFNVFGTLTVLVIPPLVAQLAPGAPPAAGIHAMGWFIVALAPLTALAAAAIVPEGDAPSDGHRVRLADVRRVLADARMVRLLAVDLLLSIAPGITGALFLFFFTAARGVPQGTASALPLGYFIAGLVSAPVWIRLARSWGKHRAAMASALWFAVAILGIVLVPKGHMALAAVSMAIAGVPFAAPGFLLRAMMADLNDAQQLDRRNGGTDGAETTGLNFAILTATQKLGYAIPVGLAYPLLALIGFDPAPGAQNGPSAILGLELLFALPSALLAVVAALLIRTWPITADVHAEIRARLASA
jgi:Na+/melibiose symporter-like transporter